MSDEELPIPLDPKGSVRAVTPDGSRLVIWAPNEMQVWDLSATPAKILHRIPAQAAVGFDSQTVIAPDGKWLAAKYSHTALFRLDAPEPKLVAWLDKTDAGGGPGPVTFSPDGSKAIVANANGLVRFWDLGGPEPKEVSPLDPAGAFLAPGAGSGPPHSTLRPAALLLLRMDSQPNGRPRYQHWGLAAKAPQAGPLLEPEPFGWMSAATGDSWVQATWEGRSSCRYRIADGKFEPVGQPFGPANVNGSVSPDGKTFIFYAHDAPSHLEAWDRFRRRSQAKMDEHAERPCSLHRKRWLPYLVLG